MINKIDSDFRENLLKYMEKNWEVDEEYIGEFKKYIENGLVYDDGIIKGAATYFVVDESEKKYAINIYVAQDFRRKGIGLALYNNLMDILKEFEPSCIEIELEVLGDSSEEFYKKLGYEKWYGCHNMTYRGGYHETSDLEIIPFNEKYYDEMAKIAQAAFYELRKENDIKPHLISISGGLKKYYLDNKDNLYLGVINGEIVAGGMSKSGYLDDISVKPKYQGRGLGKKITQFCINKALSQGEKKIYLDVIEWNKKATKMYEGLGFEITKTVRVYRSFLK